MDSLSLFHLRLGAAVFLCLGQLPSTLAQSATITAPPPPSSSFSDLDFLTCWAEGNTCLTKSSIMASCSSKHPSYSDLDQNYGCLCAADYSSANKACVEHIQGPLALETDRADLVSSDVRIAKRNMDIRARLLAL